MRWERKTSKAKIPVSFQFSILLGKFVCVIPRHVSSTSGAARIVDGMVGAGDGRIDGVKDAWVMAGMGLGVIEEHKRGGKCIDSDFSQLALQSLKTMCAFMDVCSSCLPPPHTHTQV